MNPEGSIIVQLNDGRYKVVFSEPTIGESEDINPDSYFKETQTITNARFEQKESNVPTTSITESNKQATKEFVDLFNDGNKETQPITDNILNITQDEYTDEFRRVQERVLENSEEASPFHTGKRVLGDPDRQRLGRVLQGVLHSSGTNYWTNLLVELD